MCILSVMKTFITDLKFKFRKMTQEINGILPFGESKTSCIIQTESFLFIMGLWPHHLETLVPVQLPKLSNAERGQHLDG